MSGQTTVLAAVGERCRAVGSPRYSRLAGTGGLSAAMLLGIGCGAADELTGYLVREIVVRGVCGGLLTA